MDNERFEEELEDSGGDLDLWAARKAAENDSFYGFEIDPEKEKRLNRLKSLCRKLRRMDSRIHYKEEPIEQTSRHGIVILDFPALLFCENSDEARIMAGLFASADDFCISSLTPDDEQAEAVNSFGFSGKSGGRVRISFSVHDLWHIYGKAPF